MSLPARMVRPIDRRLFFLRFSAARISQTGAPASGDRFGNGSRDDPMHVVERTLSDNAKINSGSRLAQRWRDKQLGAAHLVYRVPAASRRLLVTMTRSKSDRFT